MNIRAFTTDDTEKMMRVFALNVPQYFAAEEAQELAAYLIKYGDTYFTLEEKGEIIGGLGYIIKEKEGHITWIFIHPEKAGKGFGKQAVSHCLKLLKTHENIEKLVVRTSQFADKFFASLGYELLYIKKDYWAQGIDLYYMEINLTMKNNNLQIRLIQDTDSQGVLAVYKPYIENTAITFEYDVPESAAFLERIKNVTAGYPWLVCLENNEVIGYAYASKYRDRVAYQWAAESAIYLKEGAHRKGIARILYEALFQILRLQGYTNLYAIITLPNVKSVGFHQAMGFQEIGIFRNVGYKMNKWHDVIWFEKQLTAHLDNPAIPTKMEEILTHEAVTSIIEAANLQIKQC